MSGELHAQRATGGAQAQELAGAITIFAHYECVSGASLSAIALMLFLLALVRLRVAWAAAVAVALLSVGAVVSPLAACAAGTFAGLGKTMLGAALSANLVVAIVRSRRAGGSLRLSGRT